MYAAQFNGITITQKREFFARTASGKSWQKKPYNSTTETIPAQNYINAAGFPWKGDRVERGYTYAGYIPIRITSTSPDGNAKCVWTWSLRLDS